MNDRRKNVDPACIPMACCFTGPFLAACLLCPADASVITIDDFSDAQAVWPNALTAPGETLITETGLSGVLGGSRQTTLAMHSLITPGLDFVQANIATGAGQFDFASSSGAKGGLTLFYNADGLGLGAFFADKPGVVIGFSLFDHAGGAALPVEIVLFDGANTASLKQTLESPGPQTLLFKFEDFDDIGALGLAYVQSVEIVFDPAMATDFRLTHIAVVPGPGALALLGVAGIATGRRRRS